MLSSLLIKAGLKDLASLLSSRPEVVENITERKSPFGRTLIQEAHKLPRYNLDVSQISEQEHEDPILLIRVSYGAEKSLPSTKRKNVPKSSLHKIEILIGNTESNELYLRKSMTLQKLWQADEICFRLPLTKSMIMTPSGSSAVIDIHVLDRVFGQSQPNPYKKQG